MNHEPGSRGLDVASHTFPWDLCIFLEMLGNVFFLKKCSNGKAVPFSLAVIPKIKKPVSLFLGDGEYEYHIYLHT